MPRFLHTGDLHLNALRDYEGFLGRAERTLNQISDLAIEEGVDAIVVAGDLYHSQSISHLERQLLSDWLGSCPVPLIAISGNHETRSEELGDTTLSYLARLKHKRHIVHDGAPRHLKKCGCSWLLFPYHGWTHTEFTLLLDVMLEHVPTNRPVVVVLHEYVTGAKTDTGFEKKDASKIVLTADRFPQVTYWALGDVHKCQPVLPNAWYCGAPHQTKFDEVLPKGVLLMDTDAPTEPTFVELQSTPLLFFEELPESVPEDAFVQFKPTTLEGAAAAGDLPPNVKYHPSTQLFKDQKGARRPVEYGLFAGLDEHLREAGLSTPMRRRSWRLLKQLGAQASIAVTIPKQYRRRRRK